MNMKITIITVYNSHNYGSFLQAKQLYHTLSAYGDVWFYNSHSRKITKTFLRKVKKIITTNVYFLHIIKGTFFEFNEMLRLKQCWNSLPNYDGNIETDIICLGSDEIWNINRKECRYPIYWGAGIESYKVAYAPSINNADEVDFDKAPEYINYLKKVDLVSTRDKHSKSIISKLSNKKIEIVLDPTLLKSPKTVEFHYKKPYIAIYLFYGTLTKDEKNEIVDFARKRNLDLVSAGQYISWCDHCTHSHNGDPFYIYKGAEYVITNTFHGTAYAINYNAKFVALVRAKTKVIDMLKQFELFDRIAQRPEDIEKILNNNINYSRVNQILQRNRTISEKFIKDAMEGYKE